MIQVRRNVFETNSSSTHSLAVPQSFDTHSIKKRKITFHLGSYGRPSKPIKALPADYLYTAIMQDIVYFMYDDKYSEEDRDAIIESAIMPDWRSACPEIVSRLDKLEKILKQYHIKYEFEEPVWESDSEGKVKIYEFMRAEKYAKKCYFTIRSHTDGTSVRHYYLTRDFGIDHGDEAIDIADELLANPEECIKFLLGGKVFVGSDEASDLQCAQIHWNKKTYSRHYWVDENGKETRWSWNSKKKLDLRQEELPNPYYMEGYNYYLKGN